MRPRRCQVFLSLVVLSVRGILMRRSPRLFLARVPGCGHDGLGLGRGPGAGLAGRKGPSPLCSSSPRRAQAKSSEVGCSGRGEGSGRAGEPLHPHRAEKIHRCLLTLPELNCEQLLTGQPVSLCLAAVSPEEGSQTTGSGPRSGKVPLWYRCALIETSVCSWTRGVQTAVVQGVRGGFFPGCSLLLILCYLSVPIIDDYLLGST